MDLTGQRFGRLVAIERVANRKKKTYWLCQCDCGNTHEICTGLLRSGNTQSCGCLYRVDHEAFPLACQRPTKRYPSGRTGTISGYLAHYYVSQKPCAECLKGAAMERAEFRADNELTVLRDSLWNRHRLRLERYLQILESQDNRCAICGVDAPRDIRSSRFHVDHDHACCPGKQSCGECVRGLLCHACNTALGNFADDRGRLQRAIEYLDRRQP